MNKIYSLVEILADEFSYVRVWEKVFYKHLPLILIKQILLIWP